ncbi:MAG TPA: lysophospholipid acyltransferase family protein, partial [Steroidobacteraceae bacterium]|nr:lysophospholipid acyltransferase family protein [Steroidobacteraceae bacterium]
MKPVEPFLAPSYYERVSLRANFYWRTVVTSGCFIAFALCGLLFSTLLYVPLRVLGEYGRVPAKWLVHKFFWGIVTVLRGTGCMRLDVAGLDRLRNAGPVIVLANHPTYIDFVVLLSLLPKANCVVKREHWDNPVFGGMVRAAGFVRSSRADQLAVDCARALQDGNPLIIFPEGTRSDPGAPVRFRRGAGYAAVKSGRPIVPVVLKCDPPTLNKNSRWWQVPSRPFHYCLAVRAMVLPDMLGDVRQSCAVTAARRLTGMLEGYFGT